MAARLVALLVLACAGRAVAQCNNFPLPWANARSWTGSISSTATGSGTIAPNGSYSITQTVTGTVELDQHQPLEDLFEGKVNFTVTAHEHYELPNPDGSTSPIDVVSNDSVDETTNGNQAFLAFDFTNCTYYFYVEPQGVAATLNGNPSGYVLGPVIQTPAPDLFDSFHLPLPEGSLPQLTDDGNFQAHTTLAASFDGVGLEDWTVHIELTPESCTPLTVPKLKQISPPWKWDTYDKYSVSSQILLAGSTQISANGNIDLLDFPQGTSQGNPSAASVTHFSLANNTLQGLDDAMPAIARLEAPNQYHPNGSVLILDPTHINSYQLLSTPGDPTSNMLRKISQFGCFMTCATMIYDYYGGNADPRQMNDWLNDQADGFGPGHDVNTYAVVRYAKQHGVTMSYVGKVDKTTADSDVQVEKYLCSGNPVMLKVSPCQTQNPTTCPHFVVATGKVVKNGELVWSINDPGFDNSDDMSKYGNYFGYRLFTGPSGGPQLRAPAAAASQPAVLVISVAPSFEVTVTDPQGRQELCGLPVSLGDGGIPDSACTTEGPQNDELVSLDGGVDVVETQPPDTVFEVSPPLPGDYRVSIVNLAAGDFDVEALSYDSNGAVTKAVAHGTASGPGGAQYTISYSPDAAVVIAGPPVADAGVPDAGPPDAGPPDAGITDAGIPDAGVPDAGGATPDAGSTGGTGKSGGGGCDSTGGGGFGLLLLLALYFFSRGKRPIR